MKNFLHGGGGGGEGTEEEKEEEIFDNYPNSTNCFPVS